MQSMATAARCTSTTSRTALIGANAVVGGGLPAITGAALSFKLRGQPRVAVAFFGDGATNIGTFHEALNLAQLWKVPAVFVCENNGYAESTPAWQQLPIHDLSKRAVAFGMHTIVVDGQDDRGGATRPRSGRRARARRRRAPSTWSRTPTGSPGTTSAIRRSTGRARRSATFARIPDPLDKLRIEARA